MRDRARNHRRALTCGVLVAALLAVATGTAMGGTVARVHAHKTPAAEMTTLLSFSPIHGNRAGTVRMITFGCGKGQSLTAQYSHQRGTAKLVHSYVGKLSSCHLNTSLSSGTITAHWSTALNMKLSLTATKPAKVTHVRLSKGCYATNTAATLRASGTFKTAIHQAQFGTLARSRFTVQLVRFVFPSCLLDGDASGSGTSLFSVAGGVSGSSASLKALLNSTTLEADWGHDESLEASTAKGEPSTVSFSEPAKDGPIPSVSDTFALQLSGGGAFHATKLTGATLNFTSPVSTGSLTFTAGIGCPPTVRANDGTLAGTVTIDDPVLGKFQLTGTEMGEAQISILDSDSYKCAPKGLL